MPSNRQKAPERSGVDKVAMDVAADARRLMKLGIRPRFRSMDLDPSNIEDNLVAWKKVKFSKGLEKEGRPFKAYLAAKRANELYWKMNDLDGIAATADRMVRLLERVAAIHESGGNLFQAAECYVVIARLCKNDLRDDKREIKALGSAQKLYERGARLYDGPAKELGEKCAENASTCQNVIQEVIRRNLVWPSAAESVPTPKIRGAHQGLQPWEM